jgi:hypothetical protein
MKQFDWFSALTVGNGEFAFTAGITSLQTFAAQCDKTFPLCTTAHRGWHSKPAPDGIRRGDFRCHDFDTYGRAVGYATERTGQEPLFDWLRENPHRLHLGRIGLELKRPGGAPATQDGLKNCEQTLDLWTGVLETRSASRPAAMRTWIWSPCASNLRCCTRTGCAYCWHFLAPRRR